MRLDVYCDPGHAWLKVPTELLSKLGIAEDITVFSYQRGEFSYLEEDCDAPTFLRAAEQAGMSVTLVTHVANQSSRIRNYDHYRQP